MTFVKGTSGNPAGRPKKENCITSWLKELLEEENGGGQPVARTIAKKLITESKKGEPWAIKELLDRAEGKAIQRSIIEFETRAQAMYDELVDVLQRSMAAHGINDSTIESVFSAAAVGLSETGVAEESDDEDVTA